MNIQGIPSNLSSGSVLFQFNMSIMEDSMKQAGDTVQQLMAPIASPMQISGSTIDISI